MTKNYRIKVKNRRRFFIRYVPDNLHCVLFAVVDGTATLHFVSAVDSQRRCPGSGSSSTIWWRRQVCSQSCPRCLGRICHYLKHKSVSVKIMTWLMPLDRIWSSKQSCWLDVKKKKSRDSLCIASCYMLKWINIIRLVAMRLGRK